MFVFFCFYNQQNFSSHTNEFLRECQGSGLIDNESSIRGRSRLNDRERRQAALPILVLGNELVFHVLYFSFLFFVSKNESFDFWGIKLFSFVFR